jgi:hypothetical protein
MGQRRPLVGHRPMSDPYFKAWSMEHYSAPCLEYTDVEITWNSRRNRCIMFTSTTSFHPMDVITLHSGDTI